MGFYRMVQVDCDWGGDCPEALDDTTAETFREAAKIARRAGWAKIGHGWFCPDHKVLQRMLLRQEREEAKRKAGGAA